MLLLAMTVCGDRPLETAEVPEIDLIPHLYDDSSGEWVGRTEVGAVLGPTPRVRGDLLAGVLRDELGVESVVLFRLQ